MSEIHIDRNVEEKVEELRGEIQKFLESDVIGMMPINDVTLRGCIEMVEAIMRNRLPGHNVECLNPRIEGNSIVWDGFFLTPKEGHG